MPFIQLIPANSGGGNKRQPPGARFGSDGQLTINHNAAELLGEPETILAYAAEKVPALRIAPPPTPTAAPGCSPAAAPNNTAPG